MLADSQSAFVYSPQAEKVYFPNLNGFRFIASLLVIICHVEIANHHNKGSAIIPYQTAAFMGRQGVILFFALSGFLITYLLINEQLRTGKVAIRDFYMRRILKIWPLYYLIVGLSFFVLPLFLPATLLGSGVGAYLIKNLELYIFFLPNIAIALYPTVWGATQAWSVGVEEQFYLIWPLLIIFVKPTPKLFIGFIGGYEIVKFFVFRVIKKFLFWNPMLETFREFWDKSFPIECLAIGGVFAYLVINYKTAVLRIIFNPYLQLAVAITILTLVASGIYIYNVNEEVLSVLYGVVITNAAVNPKTVFKLENPLLNYLGKISYGIYMYHFMILFVYMYLAGKNRSFLTDYLIILFGTILLSAFSYEFFEKKFLRLKKRFTIIKSGSI